MLMSSRVESLDSLTDLESSIEPALISEFLVSNGWGLVQEREGVAELWTAPDYSERNRRVNVFLPYDREFIDFNRRFRECLADLSLYYSTPLAQLVEQIGLVSTDLFLIRLDQETVDGTIPLDQATALMESLKRMVRAAATAAVNPNHRQRGRRPQQVHDFLHDNLRFGHTRRGSFILTVAARLDDADTLAEQRRARHRNEGSEENLDQVIPYPRQVMTTLARGLEAAAHYIHEDIEVPDVDTAMAHGVSVDLVQSLLEISGGEGLKSVDLSFRWADRGTPPDVGNRVTFSRGDVTRIEAFRDRLIRRQEPMSVELVGRVAALERDERPGFEANAIVLEADVDGRLRKVRVTLTDEDYDWAIRAHQARLLFTVSGTLVKKKSWEIEGLGRADVGQLRILLDT